MRWFSESVFFFLILAGAEGQDCGGILDDPNGTISSPNYPDEYPPNSECVWFISVSSPITLTFEEFALDDNPGCETEFLEILESDGQRIFCGESNPGTLVTEDFRVTIAFESDSNPSPDGDRRFFITYTSESDLTCESDWIPFLDDCYWFGSADTSSDQAAARQACHDLGAELASIHSEEEDLFVASRTDRSFNFIGAVTGPNFENDQTDFQFLDDSPADFDNFHDSPVALASDSWVVDTVDRWMNFPCDLLLPFVCESGSSSLVAVHDEPVTFQEAINSCLVGGELPIRIETPEMRGMVLTEFLNAPGPLPTRFWIGLEYKEDVDAWIWTQDGTQLTLDNWVPGYPEEGAGNCAAAVTSSWATVNVPSFGWVCKKPKSRSESQPFSISGSSRSPSRNEK